MPRIEIKTAFSFSDNGYTLVSHEAVGDVVEVSDECAAVAIGVEHGVEPLSACSVVVAPVVIDGEHLGSVGVLGPTRMNYPQALATVEYVSEQLGHRIEEG